MLCARLDGSGVLGRMDPGVCMAESLHCSPETVTTLVISYTLIQNVFGVKKINKNERIISLKSLALLPPCWVSLTGFYH